MGKKYDYLIVGSGLFGSVFAHEATERGKSCLVVERRGHVGGNVYCEKKDDIVLHKYGVHVFHTDNKTVWDYMNRFVGLDDFVLSPLANYRGETYPLPFNLNTFRKLWGIETAEEAAAIIEKQRGEVRGEPRNLEEQAISLVGKDIYEKLIKGYTAKQWGRPCNELPAFIIRRLPVRYTADNSYFNDRYQGVPREGYNALFEKLLGGSEVLLNTDYLLQRESLSRLAGKTVYTGSIDSFFNYELGPLAYRSLDFETSRLEKEFYQQAAVINFTDEAVPYTRIIEHKHFAKIRKRYTYITKEYPLAWVPGREAYYPLADDASRSLYKHYASLASGEKNIIFGGRLGEYRYYDMDEVIESALKTVEKELK